MLIVVVVSTQSPTLERRQLCVVAGRPGSFTVVDSVIQSGARAVDEYAAACARCMRVRRVQRTHTCTALPLASVTVSILVFAMLSESKWGLQTQHVRGGARGWVRAVSKALERPIGERIRNALRLRWKCARGTARHRAQPSKIHLPAGM